MTPIEDFIKQNNLQIPATQPNKWLSKDRFWTLIFAFGMSAGFSTALFLPIRLGSSLFWITLIGMPILVKIFNGTTHKDGKFFTSEGRELNLPKDFPAPLSRVIVSTGVLSVICGLMLDKTDISDPYSTVIIFSAFCFIPAFFFLYKNCPIAILFNRHLWQFEDGNYIPSNSSRRMNDESSQRRYSITRSYCPGNMNYNRTHRR